MSPRVGLLADAQHMLTLYDVGSVVIIKHTHALPAAPDVKSWHVTQCSSTHTQIIRYHIVRAGEYPNV